MGDCQAQDTGANLCEELRWLFGKVADNTGTTGDVGGSDLDLWTFRRERPQPIIVDSLLRQLQVLAERGASRPRRGARCHAAGHGPQKPNITAGSVICSRRCLVM